MTSNQLILAKARKANYGRVIIEEMPTLAQMGALAEIQDSGSETNLSDWSNSCPSKNELRSLARCWRDNMPEFWSELDNALIAWRADSSSSAAAAVGYWLGSVCREGMGQSQVIRLARFLAEPKLKQPASSLPSIRRYPTGGISEKQAIVLPVVLQILCDSFGFCSSFLIARRLAHTGGTRDKLSILPGFSPFGIDALTRWQGESPRIRYFTATSDFCPKDEALYFLRGETGTVVELGLMVSSILAKQYAMPAEVIIIDVLYGRGAFLRNQAEAKTFVKMGTSVARELGLNLLFMMRPTNAVAWRSIGNVAELYESVENIWEDVRTSDWLGSHTELGRSLLFAQAALEKIDVTRETVRQVLELKGSRLKDALATLWAEHSVESTILQDLRSIGAQTVLSDLHEELIPATTSGTLYCGDVEALADLVSNCLNAYLPTPNSNSVLLGGPRKGGILFAVPLGRRVKAGHTKVAVYSEIPISHSLLDRIDKLLPVREMSV